MSFTEYITMILSGILEGFPYILPPIVFGLFTGYFTTYVSMKKGLGLESAVIKSLLISIIPPLAYFFVFGLYSWQDTKPNPTEWSTGGAIKYGVAYMLFLGVGFGIMYASSSLFTCLICYFGFRRCKRWTREIKEPNKT